MYHRRAVQLRLTIIEVLPIFLGNMLSVNVTTAKNQNQQSGNRVSTERQQSVNWASTERQRFPLLHLSQSKGYAIAFTQNQHIAHLYGQYG